MKKSIIRLWIVCVFIGVMSSIYAKDAKPIAQFSFIKTAYQENEPIEVKDESYSLDGTKIMKREWRCTIKGNEKTSSSLTKLLSGIKVGQYEVFLRVKDDKGNYSDWTKQVLKVIPVETFKITSFKSEQATYAIGEKLQLTYTYTNPNDLQIKSQRWRYRNLTTNGQMLSTKPRYFKKAGVYEVSLELQDEWGNWSNKVTCKVNVSSQVIERNGYYLFEKGKPGDLIENYIDKDYNTLNEANVLEIQDIPGTLIMSNSPESVPSSGILYQDTVLGKGRLILHHGNQTGRNKKLMIVVSTPEEQSVTLKINNEAIKGPSKHVLQTGQNAIIAYLKGGQTKTYTIKPGSVISIYDSSLVGIWRQGELISGTLDFESTGKVTIKVVTMDESSGMNQIGALQVLARDQHDRGTFNVIERQYILDLKDITEPVKLVLGKQKTEWLQGIDALTGEVAYDRGNYGLPIRVTIKNNEDIGIIANARGGGILGAIKWNKQSIVKLPNEEILDSHAIAALVGTVKANTTNEILYMLPNGSSAPILFGFIPKSQWK